VTATAAETRLPDATWLKQAPLVRLLDILNANGEESRVVGGAVRNALLGEPLGDVDIATTMEPAETIQRVTRAGFKAVPTGLAHGTVTVVVRDKVYEVTSLREDVETFGRKAAVRFGRDWKRDAERRDFTLNALSVSTDGVVHDYVGGLADLAARRIRFIGEAEMRIREDYLRILRFFRFHAAYGEGKPDEKALHACIALRHGLAQLSRERVHAEMMKLLVARHARRTLEVMAESGLLLRVLGGVPTVATCGRMIAIELALHLPADPIRRLAALAVITIEDAARLGDRLRLSNAESNRLAAAAAEWPRIGELSNARASRARLYRLGPASFSDSVLLAWARAGAAPDDPAWKEVATLPDRWQAPRSPFRAADLIARGVIKGPPLGAALAEAEAAWIADDFPDDAAAQTALLERIAQRHRN
jgi:poly(A) polymerase